MQTDAVARPPKMIDPIGWNWPELRRQIQSFSLRDTRNVYRGKARVTQALQATAFAARDKRIAGRPPSLFDWRALDWPSSARSERWGIQIAL